MTNENARNTLMAMHHQVCFESGDHPDEIDTPYSVGADAITRAEAAEAKLAKAVRLMELSVELATWNTTLLDDAIFFITELKESDA